MHERSARARIRTVVITAVLTLLASMLSVVFAIPAAAASCPDVVVIGARGSAEQPQPPNTVASAAKDPSKFYGIGEALYKNVYKSFYDGATANNLVVDVSPVNYSAVPVARILTGQFTASVQEGVTNTLDQIQEVVNRPCAVTPQIVLMGYSQGALVVTTALSQLQTSERKAAIKAVYLIGDPLYDSTQPFSHGHAGGGNGLITNGVLQFLAPILAGRWSIEGLAKNVASLAKATKPLPTELSNRAYDFCEPRDPMCQPMYAGLGTVAKFFAGRHTPHDDYKLRVNKDAVTWLIDRVKKNLLTISTPPGMPTGGTVTVNGTCPTGSTRVAPNSNPGPGGTDDPNYPVNPDGSFTVRLNLSMRQDQFTDIDPSTGLPVWPAQNFVVTATCLTQDGGSYTGKSSATYSTSRGKAVPISVTENAGGYHVTFGSSSPCPSVTQANQVTGYVAWYPRPVGSASPGYVGYDQAYPLNPDGTWQPFGYDVPKFAGGTMLVITPWCGTKDEPISFVFSTATLTYPAA